MSVEKYPQDSQHADNARLSKLKLFTMELSLFGESYLQL